MTPQITKLATKFKELRAQSEEQTKALKELNLEWEAVEKELLEAMAEEGVRSVDIEGLGKFYMTTKNYLSVNIANKPSFYDYLQESGNGNLLKLDVNPRTLTAFLKGHLEELISQKVQGGLDQIEARNQALEFLNKKGASYFVDRGVSFKEE